MKIVHSLAIIFSCVGFTGAVWAQTSSDDAFRSLLVAATPRSIGGAAKTPEQLDLARQQQHAGFKAAADQAKQFYERYPAHPKAREARKIEVESLLRAVRAGAVEHEPKAMRIAAAYRSDLANVSRDRFRVAALVRELAMPRNPLTSRAAILAEYEKTALDLFGEFHDEPAVYDMFLGVARNAEPAKARTMAERILRMPAPAATKEQAQAIIDRFDMPGKAIAFEWQDEAGRSHKIADYAGKVVVFYVWASWTPASQDADPKIRTLVPRDAVLVSVNVDTKLTEGKNARTRASLGGIAYYDDRGLQGPLARQLRASQVPAVHLVDARGRYIGCGAPDELTALLRMAVR